MSNQNKYSTILDVLVGSHAHGLATPESDVDHRSVFIVSTKELLSLNFYKSPHVLWSESHDLDGTGFELGEFLIRALRGDPLALEVFRAPVISSTPLGEELRGIFSDIWSSEGVYRSFGGYSTNQRKKITSSDPKYSKNRFKYASACALVLIQGTHLLRNQELLIEVPAELKSMFNSIRDSKWSTGEIIDLVDGLDKDFQKAYNENSDKQADLVSVNKFLIKSRELHWNK